MLVFLEQCRHLLHSFKLTDALRPMGCVLFSQSICSCNFSQASCGVCSVLLAARLLELLCVQIRVYFTATQLLCCGPKVVHCVHVKRHQHGSRVARAHRSSSSVLTSCFTDGPPERVQHVTTSSADFYLALRDAGGQCLWPALPVRPRLQQNTDTCSRYTAVSSMHQSLPPMHKQ